jgi:hypothetical protein
MDRAMEINEAVREAKAKAEAPYAADIEAAAARVRAAEARLKDLEQKRQDAVDDLRMAMAKSKFDAQAARQAMNDLKAVDQKIADEKPGLRQELADARGALLYSQTEAKFARQKAEEGLKDLLAEREAVMKQVYKNISDMGLLVEIRNAFRKNMAQWLADAMRNLHAGLDEAARRVEGTRTISFVHDSQSLAEVGQYGGYVPGGVTTEWFESLISNLDQNQKDTAAAGHNTGGKDNGGTNTGTGTGYP